MNDTKWSPGPWEIRKRESSFGPLKWVEITPEHSHDWIAKVLTVGFIHGEANANLIAAAPDLYAACNLAFDALLDFGQHGTADIVAKALLKARGER